MTFYLFFAIITTYDMEKQTHNYYTESVVDFSTLEGLQLHAELEETGEIPERLQRELGSKALEASHVLVRLPGEKDGDYVHRWMDVGSEDAGTFIRGELREGEEQTPEQQLGLPPAEDVARSIAAREAAENPNTAAEREVNAKELLTILDDLRTEEMQDLVSGNNHRIVQRGSRDILQSTNVVVQGLRRGDHPSVIARSQYGEAVKWSIQRMQGIAHNIDVEGSLGGFGRRAIDVGQRLEQFSRTHQVDDSVRGTVQRLEQIMNFMPAVTRNIYRSAESTGLISRGRDAATNIGRVLDEAMYNTRGGEGYASSLMKNMTEFQGMHQQYEGYCNQMRQALEEIDAIKHQLRRGAAGDMDIADRGVPGHLERDLHDSPSDIMERAEPGQFASEESIESAQRNIDNLDDHTKFIIKRYRSEEFGKEDIEQIRFNPDLRDALSSNFEMLLRDYPNQEELPERVRRNDPNNKKAINHNGYPVTHMTSHEYVATLMLSMLDGTFDYAREDKVQTGVMPGGAPAYGQHRSAARILLRSLMTNEEATKRQPLNGAASSFF